MIPWRRVQSSVKKLDVDVINQGQAERLTCVVNDRDTFQSLLTSCSRDAATTKIVSLQALVLHEDAAMAASTISRLLTLAVPHQGVRGPSSASA